MVTPTITVTDDLAGATPVQEAQSYQYTATLRDGAGAPIPKDALTDVRLTVKRTDGCLDGAAAIVNDRDNQDVLTEDHGVTIDATSGVLTWLVEPADLTIGDPRRCFARHQARFEVAAGPARGSRGVTFDIERAE
jgi:hypothetical protein